MSKKIKIGLFGFGCVGQGLYEVLNLSRGIDAEILKICVKNPEKDRPLPLHRFTYDPDEILQDPEINLVVELIDDAEAAYGIVTKALKAKKAVVSANKKLIATHFIELQQLQQSYGMPLLYEAACAGSIPLIRNLEEYYDNDLLHAVEGILNGSTNFILSRAQHEGLGFPEALAMAQEKGFAESNPQLDISGQDPRYKLALVIAHAFGDFIPPEQILCSGIETASTPEFRLAGQRGKKLKLLARALRGENGIRASVLPAFIPSDHPLSQVNDEYNGVLLKGAFSEQQFLSGKGAGAYPTGSAVLSDVSALRYGYRYEYRKSQQFTEQRGLEDFELTVYVRYRDPGVLSVLTFLEVHESFRNEDFSYLIGRIQSAELQRFLLDSPPKDVFIAEWMAQSEELSQPLRKRELTRV